MRLCNTQAHFIGVMIARLANPGQDIAKLRFIVDETQQRPTAGAFFADAEDVLSGRVKANDQQAIIQQDNARIQAVEDTFGVVVKGAVATGLPATRLGTQVP